jgi:hypothetical protein
VTSASILRLNGLARRVLKASRLISIVFRLHGAISNDSCKAPRSVSASNTFTPIPLKGRAANSLPTLRVLDRPAAGLGSFHNSKRVVARRNASMQICMSCERRLRIWYDLRLLSGDRPLPIATLTQRLHNLGQKLGDGHGLATLFACRYPLPNARIEGRLKKQTITSPTISARFISRRRSALRS